MSIQFNEPEYTPAPVAAKKPAGLSLTGLVIKAGLAKDEAGANIVLIIVLLVVIALTIGVWLLGSVPADVPLVPEPTDVL